MGSYMSSSSAYQPTGSSSPSDVEAPDGSTKRGHCTGALACPFMRWLLILIAITCLSLTALSIVAIIKIILIDLIPSWSSCGHQVELPSDGNATDSLVNATAEPLIGGAAADIIGNEIDG